MENKYYDLVVIGGGSAGLASALSAKDEGIDNILILEKNDFLGGILLQCIHAGFGLKTFKEELTGPQYAERFVRKVSEKGISYKLNSTVLDLKKENDLIYITYSSQEGYSVICAKAVVLALGCIERARGHIAIPGDRPSGVMSAGLAQKYINIDGKKVGKKVFILGSGDIGLIMARRMVLEGATVLGVAEIMPYSNGLNRNIVQCLNDYNIPLYLSHTVVDIIGKNRLEKIVIAKVDENLKAIKGTEKEIECDTLLLSVGLIPSISLMQKAGIAISPLNKSAIVNDNLETSIKGIFACGNGLHVHDLVDFVTEEGTRAGKSASDFIKGNYKDDQEIEVLNGENIAYCLPHKTKISDVTIAFRVRRPMKECVLEVRQNEKIIKSVKKMYLIPSEMEHVSLSGEMLDNCAITISAREDNNG